MRLSIDRIILHNFKGLAHENLLFDNTSVAIFGANGAGKSTVACGWYWLMADCSETLVSNPAIFPLDAEEVIPSVEVVCNVDGKTITLERQVRRTVKKSEVDGVADAVSFSSTYLVNSVEYGLRDFKKKLEEYGITDRLLTLSHPDVFLSGKRDEMRKVLFGMAKGLTDLEVARQTDGAADVAKLLENYTLEEVTAMQNANIRKIKEEYGKDGEILRAKIEGLEASKIDVDFAEIELLKNALNEKLEKNHAEQEIANQVEKDLNTLREKSMTLQFELSGLRSKAEMQHKEAESKLTSLDNDIRRWKNEAQIYEDTFIRSEAEKKKLETNLENAKKTAFDDSSLVCPTCGQLYQLDKQEELKANFEKTKAEQIARIEKQISENASLLAIKRTEKAELDRKLEKAINDKAEAEKALNGASNAPETDSKEIDKLQSDITALNILMDEKKAGMPNLTNLKAEEVNLNGEIRDCEIKLSKSDDNARIDDMIADLRAKQMVYEQNKANAEKLLYEIDLISKRKNELLTEEINSHFKLVKFKMFDWQKNGTYKEVCVPQYNGKDLGVATNTGLEIRMKLDIIRGLQNFYGESYPVFVDGAEALDSNSLRQIEMDCQMIYLTVSEDNNLVVREV